MNITNEQITFIQQNIKELYPTLAGLEVKASATPFFHVQADAICWTDELPEHISSRDSWLALLLLLSHRTQNYCLSVGTGDTAYDRLIRELQQAIPTWSFLSLERNRVENHVLFEQLRDQALDELSEMLEGRFKTE